MIFTYNLHEIAPYINWSYFFHAWGLKPSPENQIQKAEAAQLKEEALLVLETLQSLTQAQCIFRLCTANSVNDDLQIEGVCFPFLRQQTAASPDNPCLCLSDFICPLTMGIPDHIGLFASTIHLPEEDRFKHQDPYQHILIQTLCDRLAEAATEKMHEEVRKKHWGYAPHEQFTMAELHMEKFQGIRPAVGYPSLPDQSVNFLLDQLLNMKQIGITLTENGAMHPHSSVSGLMLAHPAARYFSVGPIGDDQLKDYAARRGFSVEEMKKYLPQ